MELGTSADVKNDSQTKNGWSTSTLIVLLDLMDTNVGELHLAKYGSTECDLIVGRRMAIAGYS